MRKTVNLFFAMMAILSGLVSCKKELASVSLVGGGKFDDNGVASVQIVVSGDRESDIIVQLALDPSSSLSKADVSFPEVVSVTGALTPFDVKITPGEDASVTIMISDVAGDAEINPALSKVTLVYEAKANGGGNGTVEEGLTYMKDWTASLDGDPFIYGGYAYFFVNPTVPGIKYFWLETYTDEELENYYDGSLKALLEDYSADIKESLEAGDDISDVLFSSSEDSYYASYYDAGPTTLYILEFDAEGNATGRYGAVDIVLPEIDGGQDGGDDDDYDPVLTGPLTLQPEWKAYYGGRDSEDGEEYDIIIVENVTDNYFTFDFADTEGEYGYESLEEELIDIAWYNVSYGWYYEGPEDYDAYNVIDNGSYEFYIVGLDDDLNLTGNYGKSTVTIDGSASILGTPSASSKAVRVKRNKVRK